MKRSRALLTLLPIALVATMLTACTSGGGTTGGKIGDVECAPEGSISKSIEIEGDFGADSLVLKTATPISADELQRSVLIKGDGEAHKENDSVEAKYTIFSGTTGEVVASESGTLELNETQLLPWVLQVVGCTSAGDRVAAVSPVLSIFDETVAGSLGIDTSDTLVMVFDLLGVDKGCEELTPRDAKYPEVDLGDGSTEPTITIPECMEPPTELEIEVLVEGDGAVVESDQNIMTNYVGVDWNGAVRFDGSWTETGIQFSTAPGALIEGFTEAMVGQKIGSTILVTVPPELGYKDGMTRTFVLQLVGPAAG